MSRSKEWVNCPICGESDMLKSGVDDEFLIFCVNHACASNGGTNHDALVSQLQNELNEAKLVQERTDQMLNSALFQLKKVQDAKQVHIEDEEMRDEYDFSKGVRGKFAGLLQKKEKGNE